MFWLRLGIRIVNKTPNLDDLRVFCTVARKASFRLAAEELSVSAAYVSKRIKVLEADLGGARLLHRSTRHIGITDVGQHVYTWADKILGDVDNLVQDISTTRHLPSGTLRISSSLGFGRHVVAPALSQLINHYPSLSVRLELLDRLVDIGGEGFDLDIRIGDDIASHLIARRLAFNHRLLCASPDYLKTHGVPRDIGDLTRHQCLVIKERDHPFGTWKLTRLDEIRSVKVTGPFSTNHGEAAVQWALAGHGIVLRSIWDVRPLLDSGALVQVLPGVTQPASVWAVYPERLASSAKVRVCVDFLTEEFARQDLC